MMEMHRFGKGTLQMSRRLPGMLVLVLLLLGLLHTRSALAKASVPQTGRVTVSISPLQLLFEDAVTVKVGEYTCEFVNGLDVASICSNLPEGTYEVTAQAKNFIVEPATYTINVPPNNLLAFKFYHYNHQVFLPQVKPD
jgi:hypothetical protein